MSSPIFDFENMPLTPDGGKKNTKKRELKKSHEEKEKP